MASSNPISVFVPDCAPADVQSVRVGLIAKGFCPFFLEDLDKYPDLAEGEELQHRQAIYFEDCCDAIQRFGAMAIGDKLKDGHIMEQVISYCKANDIPVHVYDHEFNIKPIAKL